MAYPFAPPSPSLTVSAGAVRPPLPASQLSHGALAGSEILTNSCLKNLDAGHDEQPPTQPDPVAKARRSPQAEQKARSKRTPTGERCHSLTTLVDELATRTRNTIRLQESGATFDQLSTPTPTQIRALALIESHTLTT